MLAKAWKKCNPNRARANDRRWKKAHPEETKAHSAKWYKNLTARELFYKRIKNYGLTPEDWDGLLVIQSGKCWLCDLPMMGNKKLEPIIEHDHDTNEIRGLAHPKCNTILGLSNEDPSLLYSLYEKAFRMKCDKALDSEAYPEVKKRSGA